MAETTQIKKEAVVTSAPAAQTAGAMKPRIMGNRGRNQNNRGGKRERRPANEDGLEKRIVSIRRVSRTFSGGKRMRLSVMLVVGDKKGKVGAAVAKGADVKTAEDKAYVKAKKNMIQVNLRGTTIPHEVTHKKGAARLFMKPAAPGTGVIAGGALRPVFELVGIKDILSKVMGSSNAITNAYAAIEALQTLKSAKKRDVK